MIDRLTTRTKLLAAFGIITLGATIAAGVGLAATGALTRTATTLSDEVLASSEALGTVDQAFTAVRLHTLRGIDGARRASSGQVGHAAKRAEAARERLEKALQGFSRLTHSPEEQRLWAPMPDLFREYLERNAQVWEAIRAGDGARAQATLDGFQAQMDDQLTVPLKALAARHLEETQQFRTGWERTAAAVRRSLMLTLALTLAAAVAVGVWTTRSVSRPLEALVERVRGVRDAIRRGDVSARCSLEGVPAELAPVPAALNETMEAYARPVGMAQACLARLAEGEIPPPITEQYEGDFNSIKDALNRCIATVNAMVDDAATLARAGAEGRLSVRADLARHRGDFRKIIQGVNDTLDAVVGPLTTAARCVDAIARGDVPPRITAGYRGDFAVLEKNLNTCIDAINALVTESRALSSAAVAGNLGVRADASRHHGDFRTIIQGVNDALEAIVAPFRVMADYCERISHGDLPPRRTNAVQGEIVAMQQSLNRCLEALSKLVEDVNGLAAGAVHGELSTRADVSRHEGAFREALAGMNRTLDAVIAPVDEAAGALDRLARRDLRARVEGDYQGDHARLKDAVNATAQALQGALTQVASAVDQVSSAATQIASSSQAVASGASEQAASLEETTASLESVTGMTQQSAANAQQASALALAARTAAQDGTAAVGALQGTMGKIRASAEGTSQIIKDVSDIAFQTNLLALNAAVEAARAGEAGRGFAVVAEEVRSLALRAKEAANKTEELIRQSVRQAADGETAARQVASRLSDIAGGVSKVTDIVGEIAAAAKEQASGVSQVTAAIGEMDKVTQQNAASAEESSSAASELSSQAEELAAMVATFHLDGSAPAAAVSRRPTPRLAVAPAAPRPPAPAQPGRPAVRAAPGADAVFPMDDHAEVRDF